MLLQQQEWLVSGLLELYRRTQLSSGPLSESPTEDRSRAPSVHHILEQLGVLDENHRCDASDPITAPSPRQYSCDKIGDACETTPYPLNTNPCDEQYGVYDEVQSGSFPYIPTTAVTDPIFMPTNGDPHTQMLEFQNTAQSVDSTLSAQHSGT